MQSIEPNLFAFYHAPSVLPDEFKFALEQTQKANPDLKLDLLDDSAALDLIKSDFPPFAPLYEKIRIPAARSDIVRLLALYKYGGFYTDISMAFRVDLRAYARPEDELLVVRRDDIPEYLNREDAAHLINGVMGANAGSEFIGNCIKKVYFNLAHGLFNHVVFIATGPQVLTEVFFRDRNRFKFPYSVLSFAELRKEGFDSHRVAGINNLWVEQQRQGIIDQAFYDEKYPEHAAWEGMSRRADGVAISELGEIE